MLTACGGQNDLLAQSEPQTITVFGSYIEVADCVYNKLRQSEPGGAQKAELPHSGKIVVALDSGAVRYWEWTFASAPNAQNQTLAVITSANTLWGAFPKGRAIEFVRACDRVQQ